MADSLISRRLLKEYEAFAKFGRIGGSQALSDLADQISLYMHECSAAQRVVATILENTFRAIADDQDERVVTESEARALFDKLNAPMFAAIKFLISDGEARECVEVSDQLIQSTRVLTQRNDPN